MIYDKKNVENILPHREPFLFIDSCIDISVLDSVSSLKDLKGCSVKCKYYLKGNHPILQGHFPEKKVLPAVIQAEMLAQSLAFPLFKYSKDIKLEMKDKSFLLVGLDKFKFKKMILPDSDIFIESKIKGVVSNIVFIEGRLLNEKGEILSQGEVKVCINEGF